MRLMIVEGFRSIQFSIKKVNRHPHRLNETLTSVERGRLLIELMCGAGLLTVYCLKLCTHSPGHTRVTLPRARPCTHSPGLTRAGVRVWRLATHHQTTAGFYWLRLSCPSSVGTGKFEKWVLWNNKRLDFMSVLVW